MDRKWSKTCSKVLADMWCSKRQRIQAGVLIALVMFVSAACASAAPTPPPLTTPFGLMALYQSAEHPLSIQYPDDWTEHLEIQAVKGIEVWRTNSKGEWFVVVKNNVPDGESLSATGLLLSTKVRTDNMK